MSRLVPDTQRNTQMISTSPPIADQTHQIVVPTTIAVIAAAETIGSSDGPGRWISSPAGGVRSYGSVALTSGVDVDRGCHERQPEHDHADRTRDQAGADVLAGKLAVHGRWDPIARALRRRPSPRTAASGTRVKTGTGEAPCADRRGGTATPRLR